MTPHELIQTISSWQGQCLRFCVYCPEFLETGEVKECLEDMMKTIYKLQQDKDQLEEKLEEIKNAYKEVAGHEYTNPEYQWDSGIDESNAEPNAEL